jgi:hypothetical protein
MNRRGRKRGQKGRMQCHRPSADDVVNCCCCYYARRGVMNTCTHPCPIHPLCYSLSVVAPRCYSVCERRLKSMR